MYYKFVEKTQMYQWNLHKTVGNNGNESPSLIFTSSYRWKGYGDTYRNDILASVGDNHVLTL
jgi:hypothetical protein